MANSIAVTNAVARASTGTERRTDGAVIAAVARCACARECSIACGFATAMTGAIVRTIQQWCNERAISASKSRVTLARFVVANAMAGAIVQTSAADLVARISAETTIAKTRPIRSAVENIVWSAFSMARAIIQIGWTIVHFDIACSSCPNARETHAGAIGADAVAGAIVRTTFDHNVANIASESVLAHARAIQARAVCRAEGRTTKRGETAVL